MIAVTPKNQRRFNAVMHPNGKEGVANRVDPDQIAPVGAV